MMRRSVFPYKTRPVKAEYYRQTLNGGVVNYLIICPLRERRIDGAERLDPSRCKACRESCGMRFLYADIIKTIGKLLRIVCHAAAACQGGGASHTNGVLGG